MDNVISLTHYFEQRLRDQEKEVVTPKPGFEIPLELSLTAGVELQLQILENLAFASDYRNPAELRDFFTLRTLAASVFQNTLLSEHLWPMVNSATIKHFNESKQAEQFDEFLSVKFVDLTKLEEKGARTPVFTVDLRICADTVPVPNNQRVFPDEFLIPPDIKDAAPGFSVVIRRVLQLCQDHAGLSAYTEGGKVLFVALPINRPFGKHAMVSVAFDQ